MQEITVKIIAHIKNDYTEKFGIPRQSGIINSLSSQIIFEPEYRIKEAFRGLEGFSHLWLIWQFSEAARENWSPTVRPPKLGGNKRVGVFATRSPFRPNPIGMSAVKLEKIDLDCACAPVLTVTGADLMNNTPILDIKPYLPYADSRPEASSGFALQEKEGKLQVDFPMELLEKIPAEKREGLKEILSQDPRPAYKEDSRRVYTMAFGENQVSFTVEQGIARVIDVEQP
ncbi:MAG: tRNA (N6-threonylcarbamoyladenosine(37)-N6)-methyltransferase TrmO [Firmicutes bacterium]|nr:tRNA (N6-threonylcarbamoyladenosine(37)-N6)-methyltransferase TrmO [[Eubacterium] siraeum]MCM1488043.1 tRNA (N6-threonylcarbamoyladenosine(37)-N6)-methyltransferase TrmO [Bacillota bacterium]